MSNIVICSNEWLKKVNQLSKEDEKLLINTIAVCHKTNIKPKLPPHLLELFNMFVKENEVADEEK